MKRAVHPFAADLVMRRPTLLTPRLRLEPWSTSVLDELLALLRTPSVRRHLLDDRIVDRSWLEDEIAASERRFATGSLGSWTLRRRDRLEDVVGFCGYRPFFEPPELQLFYGLSPAERGQGLATEAARAAMRHGFEEGLDEIRAATDAPNRASVAVLERLGFERRQPSPLPEGATGATLFFALPRSRFDSRSARLTVVESGSSSPRAR